MPRMTPEELEAFLRRIEQAKLACLDDTGHPYVVPIMCLYRNGAFYLVARGRAAWRSFLQRDGRVSLNLEDGEQRAQVQGQAELVAGPVVGVPANAPYIHELATQQGWADDPYMRNIYKHEPMYHFVVRPLKITSWQGGEWAARYKHAEWSET